MATSNAVPNFTRNGRSDAVRVTAANTSSEGDGTIGTTLFLVLTADPTNGTFVEFVRWMPRATAPTATTATVGRLFLCDIATGVPTSANCQLIADITLPSANADNAAAGNAAIDVPLNIRIPAGKSLLASTHAAPAANSSWGVQAFGGDY